MIPTHFAMLGNLSDEIFLVPFIQGFSLSNPYSFSIMQIKNNISTVKNYHIRYAIAEPAHNRSFSFNLRHHGEFKSSLVTTITNCQKGVQSLTEKK